MQRHGEKWLILAGALALILAGVAQGGETERQGEPGAEQMEAMMAMAAPGEHHEHLAKLVGEWTYSGKMWMPGAPDPIEMGGTMKAEPMLGGRFIEATWTGVFMGQPFEGIAIDGYDKAKGHYTTTWRDNFGTYTLSYEGHCDDSGKVRTMMGQFTDPGSGEEVKDKGVTTVKDDGSVLMESWRIMPDGKEVKMMELALQRR